MKARCVAAALPLVLAVPAAGEEFPSQDVTLLSHIALDGFASNPTRANDCWGYVSGSGREYAFMGLKPALAVIEITNPTLPVIIAEIAHVASNWSDVKVFGDYAYLINEGGGGVDIIDLSDIDNGNVPIVSTLTDQGLDRGHNVAIDAVSGFLYLCGSNLNNGRLAAYDLADPTDPVFSGFVIETEGEYCHDAEVVTYTTGPNAGRQICFACVGSFGLDIYDVTDKSNMVRVSQTQYPNLSFAHQASLSTDRQYLYLNDELDDVNETVIFDVSDLANPVLVTTYSSGITAGDHDVYYHDGFIYEAEYRGGLRVFDATDPINPVPAGFFDTWPDSDGPGFDGAWGVYPFLPSGNVIISDKQRAFFVVRPGPAPIAFEFPDGVPDLIGPAVPAFTVEIVGQDGFTVDPASPMLHYDDGSGSVVVPLTSLGGDMYGAAFGPIDCASSIEFYVSAVTTSGWVLTDPASAPSAIYMALTGLDATVSFEDDFEAGGLWTVGQIGDTAFTGVWTPVDPIGTASQPENDHTPDPASDCFVTGQGLPQGGIGDADVDGGDTTLLTPFLDLTGSQEAVVSFWLWYSNDFFQIDADEGNAPSEDVFVVDISNDHGGSWTNMMTLGPSGEGTTGGWIHYSFRVGDFVEPTAQVVVRFIAQDVGNLSIVEAAIDDFTATLVTCEELVLGDLDGDGVVGITDFLLLLGLWGPCPDPCPPSCDADLDGDCAVGIVDFLILLANWSTQGHLRGDHRLPAVAGTPGDPHGHGEHQTRRGLTARPRWLRIDRHHRSDPRPG